MPRVFFVPPLLLSPPPRASSPPPSAPCFSLFLYFRRHRRFVSATLTEGRKEGKRGNRETRKEQGRKKNSLSPSLALYMHSSASHFSLLCPGPPPSVVSRHSSFPSVHASPRLWTTASATASLDVCPSRVSPGATRTPFLASSVVAFSKVLRS